jgi:hypothetical protein
MRDEEVVEEEIDRPRQLPVRRRSVRLVVGSLFFAVLAMGSCLTSFLLSTEVDYRFALTPCAGLVACALALRYLTPKPREGAWKELAEIGLFFGGLATLSILLLPSVFMVRDAGRRTQETNHLKEVGLGMHGYDDSKGTLPPANGDLSWRVHILPFIGQGQLYQSFDQTQP